MASNFLFKPIRGDFRGLVPGHFSYEQIQVSNFDEFEIALNNYGFIDHEYNFTNIHGKKRELTAIFIILIEHSNCFHKTSYKLNNKREYKNHEYRQYLDHRYNIIPSTKNTYNIIKQLMEVKRIEFFQDILDKYPEIKTFYYQANKMLKK